MDIYHVILLSELMFASSNFDKKKEHVGFALKQIIGMWTKLACNNFWKISIPANVLGN